MRGAAQALDDFSVSDLSQNAIIGMAPSVICCIKKENHRNFSSYEPAFTCLESGINNCSPKAKERKTRDFPHKRQLFHRSSFYWAVYPAGPAQSV
jgi:hypothetical protein